MALHGRVAKNGVLPIGVGQARRACQVGQRLRNEQKLRVGPGPLSDALRFGIVHAARLAARPQKTQVSIVMRVAGQFGILVSIQHFDFLSGLLQAVIRIVVKDQLARRAALGSN